MPVTSPRWDILGKLEKEEERERGLLADMIRNRKFTCRYDLHDIVAVFSLWHMGCDATWLDGCTG